MQSKTSFFNKTIFLKNITLYWPIWGIYLAFVICMMPINIFLNTAITAKGYTSEQLVTAKYEGYMGCVSIMTTPIICITIAIIAVMAVFSYIYNTRSSHMFHSLSVRREELFITNYLSGLLFMIVPLIVAFLLSVFVCALRGITSLEYLLIWLLYMSGMSFFFYSMTILVGMFTGLLIAVPILSVIMNFLYIGCRYIVTNIIGGISYGMTESYANRSYSIFSPLLYMINKVGIVQDWSSDEVQYIVIGGRYIIIYSITAVVFTIIAFLMYRKRRLETTGDSLSINAVKPVFRWGFAACVAFLGAMVVGQMIPTDETPMREFVIITFLVVIIGVIAFFIAEMILEKQAKVFTKRRFAEAGVFLGISIAFMIAIEGDLFGLETKIPATDQIVSAQLNMYYPISKSDADGIEQIRSLHQQIIDSKQEFENYEIKNTSDDAENESIEIRYILKNGSTMVRYYKIPTDSEYLADEDSVASKVYEMSVEPDNYLKGNICINYKDVTVKSMSMSFCNEELEYSQVDLTDEQIKDVYNALLLDISAGKTIIPGYYESSSTQNNDEVLVNALDFLISCEQGVQQISWYASASATTESPQEAWCSITLTSECKNTIAALKKYGIINEDNQLTTDKECNEIIRELYGED